MILWLPVIISLSFVLWYTLFLFSYFRSRKTQGCDSFGSLPGYRRTRRRPCPSPNSLAAFELSFSPPSSPPLLSRFPAAVQLSRH